MCLSALLCAASAAPQLYAGVNPGYRQAGQTSHQSVTKADGEVRTVQVSKAFGSNIASVSQADNSKGLSEISPADGAVLNNGAVPVVAAGGYHGAPRFDGAAVHTAPANAPYHAAPIHHAAPYHAAPVVHAAPAYAPAPAPYHAPAPAPYHAPAPAPYHAPAPAPYHAPAAYHEEKETPEPYSFTYGVADDYSKAAFNAAETSDANGAVTGEYTVALPDGRTQHVKYTADHYNGYVADVTYEGVPVYPA